MIGRVLTVAALVLGILAAFSVSVLSLSPPQETAAGLIALCVAVLL